MTRQWRGSVVVDAGDEMDAVKRLVELALNESFESISVMRRPIRVRVEFWRFEARDESGIALELTETEGGL